MRFEVRSGDRWRHDGSGRERAEIASYAKLDYGQTYTVRTKLLVEEGPRNTAEWLLLGQFHQTEDAGEAGVSPPVALEMAGEHLQVVARHTTQAITTTWPTTKVLYTDAAPLQRGRWYDLQIEVRFDPFGQGALKVWRDGTELVSYAGPLGYNDKIGPYWKNGIYRESSPETIAIAFSDVTISREASDVAPIRIVGTGDNDTLIGNSRHNRITGFGGDDELRAGRGNDRLDGGAGVDKLLGGAGRDTFVFSTAPKPGQADWILDFKPNVDRIALDDAAFRAIGPRGALDPDAFVVGHRARDAEDRVIHNPNTGRIAYDPDGTGPMEAIIFAHLTKGRVLTAGDILIV